MEGVRQALDRLRIEVEKGASRRKEADARSKKLLATLKERDNELESLHERLDLTRRILTLLKQCDEIRCAIRVNSDNIALASEKADRISERLSRVERERDTLQERYHKIELASKALEAQLDDLMA
ncbi:hypothetical protein H2248_010822 [Termitomyces sp. 'cryptogamus']|nr:hypothetical protein H2248_010822 [Termitomyces sp. 'cryptogamus']